MSETRTLIAEGKTKIVWGLGGGEVRIQSKDDITGGDGALHDVLTDKAVNANRTTCNVFGLLERGGVRTHYRGRLDEQSFRARRVEMIPLEIVARRIATGSYLKRRPDVTEGTIFEDLMIEFFEKDDPNHDPLVVIDLASRRLLRYVASKPLAEGFIGEESIADSQFSMLTPPLVLELTDRVWQVFTILEQAWAEQGVALVDLKIECGFDAETGALLVADVIDNDSWRIWPAGDKTQMRDKQVYRNTAGMTAEGRAKALGAIGDNYTWVAQATDAFANL
jgi:phosphoribosylaminoimidazole-succinocarboxamide synthase